MEELGKLEEGGRTCRLPGECDRVPEPVRESEPGGEREALRFSLAFFYPSVIISEPFLPKS